jgi:hypothetical protein
MNVEIKKPRHPTRLFLSEGPCKQIEHGLKIFEVAFERDFTPAIGLA